MATQIGKLVVSLTALTQPYDRAMKRAAMSTAYFGNSVKARGLSSMERLGAGMTKMGYYGARFENAIRGVMTTQERAQAEVAKTFAGVNRLGGAFLAMAGKVAVAAGVIGGVVGAVAMVKKALVTAANFEKLETGFATLMGSADKGKKFMNSLVNEAINLPIDFQQWTEMSKFLMAVGFSADQVIPTMRTLGDATAALGGDAGVIQRLALALGQIKAKGTVQAQEMRQLAEAGIPAWEMLAKVLGTDVAGAMKMVENRAVASEVGIKAVTEGMAARFGGAMQAQSTKAAGAWQILQNKLLVIYDFLGRSLMKAFNLDATMAAVGGWIDWLIANWGKVNVYIQVVGQVFTTVFKTIWTVGKAVFTALYDVIWGIAKAVELVTNVVGNAWNLVTGREIEWQSLMGGDSSILEKEWSGALKVLDEGTDAANQTGQAASDAIGLIGVAAEQGGASAAKAAKEWEKSQEEIAKITADVRDQVATFGMSESDKTIHKALEAGGWQDPAAMKALKIELDKLDAMKAQAELQEQAKKVIEDLTTPEQKREEAITRLNTLLEAQLITYEQYGAAVRKANDELLQQDKLWQAAQDWITELRGPLGDYEDALDEINAALAKGFLSQEEAAAAAQLVSDRLGEELQGQFRDAVDAATLPGVEAVEKGTTAAYSVEQRAMRMSEGIDIARRQFQEDRAQTELLREISGKIGNLTGSTETTTVMDF